MFKSIYWYCLAFGIKLIDFNKYCYQEWSTYNIEITKVN